MQVANTLHIVHNCHDRISNNDGKTTFSPTIAESRTSQDAQKRQRAFVRPHCVPNPKIAEIHLLRHCRDRDVMFGRRDMEHKATSIYYRFIIANSDRIKKPEDIQGDRVPALHDESDDMDPRDPQHEWD